MKTSTPVIIIKSCDDPRKWYAHLIGLAIKLLREDPDVWVALAPDGFTSVISKHDAERWEG